MANILAFAGSAREESINKKLVRIAASGAERAGATVELIDLRDFPLPVYDGDLEAKEGIPENARKLKAIFKKHDGLLLACPEYNSSITPLLKNTIDWVSRQEGDEPMVACFRGKVAGLISGSPGGLGGLRGLSHVRDILGNIGVIVLPDQFAVAAGYEAFTPEGMLKDTVKQAAVLGIGETLARVTAKVVAGN